VVFWVGFKVLNMGLQVGLVDYRYVISTKVPLFIYLFFCESKEPC
jgi:hypothetical protein